MGPSALTVGDDVNSGVAGGADGGAGAAAGVAGGGVIGVSAAGGVGALAEQALAQTAKALTTTTAQ